MRLNIIFVSNSWQLKTTGESSPSSLEIDDARRKVKYEVPYQKRIIRSKKQQRSNPDREELKIYFILYFLKVDKKNNLVIIDKTKYEKATPTKLNKAGFFELRKDLRIS